MAYQSFKQLNVWQEARLLAVEIYRITLAEALSKDFGLRDQMRRSAVSVASNIAEGYERTTDKEFLRYLDIASGSLSEFRTQLDIVASIKYIEMELFVLIDDRCCKIGAMLTNLKKARKERLLVNRK